MLLFGVGPEQATPFERELIEGRGIRVVPVDEVAADPEGAAARARALIEDRCDRLLVHFDVDVIDFTDVPLSENTGRNEGLAVRRRDASARRAARVAEAGGADGDRAEPRSRRGRARDSLERFASGLARSLASACAGT